MGDFLVLRAAGATIVEKMATALAASGTPRVTGGAVRELGFEVKPLLRTALNHFSGGVNPALVDDTSAAITALTAAESSLAAVRPIGTTATPLSALEDLKEALRLLRT